MATTVGDLQRTAAMILVVGLVIGGVSSAIAAIAAVIDQRRTIRRLVLAGTPLGVLRRAQSLQIVVPLVAGTAGSVAAGLACSTALLSAFGQPGLGVAPTMTLIGAVVAVATVIGWMAAVAARSSLSSSARFSVTTSAPQRDLR